MTRIPPDIICKKRPPLLRRVGSLAAIFALLVSGLMPWAQAVAASSGGGTLMAAICSPNGVRYVEIDLGAADREAPPAPPLDALDHCPGCLGGGASALPPVVFTLVPLPAGRGVASEFRDHLTAARAGTSFRPRAPPFAGWRPLLPAARKYRGFGY